MFVVIRGAGDIATGVALRLWRAGLDLVLCDIAQPTAIRRTVCFSEAIRLGECRVEDVTARLTTVDRVRDVLAEGIVPVLVDPEASCVQVLHPDAVVDAILAKHNLGTTMDMAPVVVGVGPGFTVGADCHACVETMRGHTMGRALYQGSPIPNTNVPGLVGGFAGERVIRAPADGTFRSVHQIGDMVQENEIVGYVGDTPMRCTLSGVLRGLLADGLPVFRGMKSGDVDPRGIREYCDLVSEKALAVGGGALEAVLGLSSKRRT